MEDKQQIETVLKTFYTHFVSKNWVAFEQLLHPDFTYYTDKCVVQSKSSFLSFLKADTWQNESHQIDNFKMIASSADLAVATYAVLFIGSFGEKQMTIHATETAVFVYTNEEWKIIHCHSSNKVQIS